MVSGKESDMKLSPEELRGKEEAVASMEHGKKPVFKEQGNREAAAESRHIGRTTGQWLQTARASPAWPCTPCRSALHSSVECL